MIRECTYLKSCMSTAGIVMSLSASSQNFLCFNFIENLKVVDWDLKSATDAVNKHIGVDLSIDNISGSKDFDETMANSNLSFGVAKSIYTVHLSGAQAKVVVK